MAIVAAEPIKIEGMSRTLKTLRSLPKKIQDKAARKATRAGGAPIVKRCRQNAARDEGDLKRAMTQKIRKFSRGGKIVAIIGPRFKKLSSGKNPGRYAHLQEEDTKAHVVPGPLTVTLPSGDRLTVGSTQHPGTKGTQFMRRSAREAKDASIARFTEKLEAEVAKEVAVEVAGLPF